VILKPVLLNRPESVAVLDDQPIRIQDALDPGVLQMAEAHAGGLEHCFLGRPISKEGFPSAVSGQLPFPFFSHTAEQRLVAGRNFLKIDADRRRRDHRGDIPRLVGNGPVVTGERTRDIARILVEGTAGKAAGNAALDERFPRASALRLHLFAPQELLVLPGERQYHRVVRQGASPHAILIVVYRPDNCYAQRHLLSVPEGVLWRRMREPRDQWLVSMACGASLLLAMTAGCKPDPSAMKEENERLREQVAKQESMLSSIQDGNKFLQQQTQLLTQEVREAKKDAIRLEAERKAGVAKLEAQLAENRKLSKDNQMMSAKTRQAEQIFHVEDKGGQSEDLGQPLAAVSKAAEEALGRNGYTLKVSVRTDQRALYVTDRKVSNPSSLEQPGFRNQYLVSIQALPSNHARLSVRAEFEKIGQGGRVLGAGNEEIAEIERRLISEIRQAIGAPGKV